MKVALVYPYAKADFVGCYPPLSLLYLAGSLKNGGHDVTVIDADDGHLSHSDILERLVEYSPNLVGIPLYSNTLSSVNNLLQLMPPNSRNWEVVIGGPHATARSEEVLKTFANCDYVLRGESDNSIVKLASCIENKSDFSNVPGLTFWREDQVVSTPEARLNKNIDGLPFPARELLDSAYRRSVYWRLGYRGPADTMMTSRGCYYNCNFCFKVAKVFRHRSPESVVEELLLLRSRGMRNVQIMDDLFVFPQSRCLKILELIKEHNMKMKFKVRARVDLINEEILAAMKDAGVKEITYGVESGSQQMLDLMNKKTTVEMSNRAVALTKKMGMRCYIDLFIGYPGETPESIEETGKWMRMTRPTGVNLAIMYPLPNTKVYEQAKAQGSLVGDWGFGKPSPWIKLPWTPDYMTLIRARKSILRRYLMHPVTLLTAACIILCGIRIKQLRMLAKVVVGLLR